MRYITTASLFFLTVVLPARGQSVQDMEARKGYKKNFVSTDAVLTAFGAPNLGYERAIYKKFSAFGTVAFGRMSFTNIKEWYGLQVRYYLTPDPEKGMYVMGIIHREVLEYNGYTEEAVSYGWGLGLKWLAFKHVLLETFFGFDINPEDTIVFERFRKNSTERVSVGDLGIPYAFCIGAAF